MAMATLYCSRKSAEFQLCLQVLVLFFSFIVSLSKISDSSENLCQHPIIVQFLDINSFGAGPISANINPVKYPFNLKRTLDTCTPASASKRQVSNWRTITVTRNRWSKLFLYSTVIGGLQPKLTRSTARQFRAPHRLRNLEFPSWTRW